MDTRTQPQTVVGGLSYVKPDGPYPINYMYPPPAGEPWQTCEYELRDVSIADMRTAQAPELERNGFILADAPTRVTDFGDENAIRAIYYAEATELALAATGARGAYVFDHLVRRRDPNRPALTFGREGDGAPSAVGRIHNDYTETSGRLRLGRVLTDPARAAAVRRYSIVNIWRSIRGPVLDTPLALCDARSVNVADLVAAEIRYPTRTGELYLATHNPHHRWWYASAIDRHEALVFKQYDSQVSGVARFTPHAAFVHPDAPAGTPPRESIEIRCLVVYD
ncbi:methyltransferase [Ralstonia sp. A12]|uniref:CmcJ/NvfI family oxidoreductase n=1 Tax=Ralstonia sp. A12 TaxID=1217052 RepID=UPI000575CEE3|nr:CmcJ/NvfI family oxidoreductase [Ralstonia sp. A12]KHK58351.1 methyltransferase [Ralstonia sp. A12]